MKTRGPSARDARFGSVRPAPLAAPGGAAGPAARQLRRGGFVLALLGFAFLGKVLLGVADARIRRAQDERTLREAERSPGRRAPAGGARTSTPAPSGPVVLGRIEIPRVGVSAIVREGTDDATLAVAIGHVARTARPGEPGNVVLAGHRDTFFRGLRRIRANDRIWIRAPGRHVEYRVESTEVVRPEETRVLARTAEDRLTLVTCYPFTYVGSAPKRFVVRAAPVAPGATAAPSSTSTRNLGAGADRKPVADGS